MDRDNKNNKEPLIAELEEIITKFREAIGEEKLAEEIKKNSKDFLHLFNMHKNDNREKEKQAEEHIVYSDTEVKNKEKRKKYISKIKETKEEVKNNNYLKNINFSSVFPFIKKHYKDKKFKYSAYFLGSIFILYLLFNIPMLYSRFTWAEKNTPKITTKTTIVRNEKIVQPEMAESAKLDPGEVIPVKSTIKIPKIDVEAPIVFVSSTKEEAIQNGLEKGVVHYKGTAEPGEVGNSFMTGHSSNYWWASGDYNYVFVLLDKMEKGDKAIAYHDGNKYVYTVTEKLVVEPEETSSLLPTKTPTMTLMTCTPPGTSWKRLIVKLKMTEPAYKKPKKVVEEEVIEIPQVISENKNRGFWEKVGSFFIPN